MGCDKLSVPGFVSVMLTEIGGVSEGVGAVGDFLLQAVSRTRADAQ